MPTSTTVPVEREALIDAIGTLYAAEHFFVVLNGRIDSDLGSYFARAASTLKQTLGEEDPEGDEEYATDPLIVELNAQECERAADLLARLAKSRELTRIVPAEELWRESFDDRVNAEKIRETGNINA